MSPTPSPQASSHALLSIGAPCSAPSCHLVDFLPFKCAHCAGAFCQEHFVPAAHACAAYDERVHDRVVPNCPACDTPIAIPPGQSPDVRMDAHLARECPAMPHTSTSTSSGKKKMPVCKQGRCGKVLYAPIKCSTCKGEFCPAHRFAKDHTCSSSTSTSTGASKPAANNAASTSKPQRSANLTANSRLLELNAKASSAGAAIKKAASTPAGGNGKDGKGVFADVKSPFADVKSPFNKMDSSPSPPNPSSLLSLPDATTTSSTTTATSSTTTATSSTTATTSSTTATTSSTTTTTTTPAPARCIPKPALSTSYAPPPLFVF